MGIFICYYFLEMSKDWRLLQIPNVTLTSVGIVFLFTMPESPRFLVSKGKYHQAREVFNRIAVFNGYPSGHASSFDFFTVDEGETPESGRAEEISASPASCINPDEELSETEALP